MECRSYYLHLALWCSSVLGWLASFISSSSCVIVHVCRLDKLVRLWFPLAETEQGVALAILRGVLDFKREPWPQISESAKSLVKQMLDPDPSKRLTAQHVLGEVLVFLFFFFGRSYLYSQPRLTILFLNFQLTHGYRMQRKLPMFL